MRIKWFIVVASLTSMSAFGPHIGSAADWPMWRADARRSGVVSESLPRELHLKWVRSLPPHRVAWPNEIRLQFDASYEPVVLGKRMFIASATDGSVTAFDTETGGYVWQFYSEGPVRLAPVAWQGRVLFGSDDGFLYCLRAETGELLWKVRGAPAERPDYRHLGNARLISYWPVRGGPVLENGTVYFGAGIWPTLGIFMHAVDAETGEIRWTNSNSNYIRNVRIDHNNLDDVGLSPQGYCLFVDDKLVVPNGRSMPARFEPETGQLLYYVQGYRNGDSRVTAGGPFLFVGERGVVSVKDGREVGNRWVEAGDDAPSGWSTEKRDLFEGPFDPYKFLPGCDYRSVFDGNFAAGVEKGVLYGYDLSQPQKTAYEKTVGSQVIHPARWDLAKKWEPVRISEQPSDTTRVTIKAGRRVYTHVGKTLFAIDIGGPRDADESEVNVEPGSGRSRETGRAADENLPVGRASSLPSPENPQAGSLRRGTKPTAGRPKIATASSKSDGDRAEPRVVWTKQLEAVPRSMLAGDEKLFVVLEGGRLCCFGGKPMEPKMHALPSEPLSGVAQGTARRLLDASGATDGYAVVLGLEDGHLVDALLQESDLRVIAVDSDTATIAALRRRCARAGVYGTRVEAFVGDPAAFGFPPYLANLVVSEKSGDSPLKNMPLEKVFSLLRPYGGAAVIPDAPDTICKAWGEARPAGAEFEDKQACLVLRRAGPLAGAADWTHETADAARTYFSADERVKAPLAVLWYGDGPDHGFEKHKDYGRGVKPQVAHGRLFAFNDIGKYLSAIDIYTGRLLWTHKTDTSIVRFVSLPEAVYVASGTKCDVLDPTTGVRTASFSCDIEFETGKQPGAVAIRATDDLLVMGLGFDLPAGHSHPAIETGLWDARVLVAFDRRTGQQLWTRTAERRFNLHSIAIGGGAVYCVDSIAPLAADELVRRGAAPAKFPSTVTALEANTGKLIWQRVFEYGHRPMTGRGPLAIRPYDDWLALSASHDLVLCGKLSEIHALRATSGDDVWSSESAGRQPLILGPDSYINQSGHRFDVTSGKQLSTTPLFVRAGGCNYTVGSKNLLFLRNKCVVYVDLKEEKEHSLRNLRSGCSNSLVAAGGLLNVPCFSTGCVCNYPLQTSFSMYHLPEAATWTEETPVTIPKED